MGYTTHFEGGVTGPDELLNVFVEDASNPENTFGEYSLELSEWLDGDFFGGDSAKWYGWNADMVEVSKKYPNLLFWLEGEGEESGDIWKAWARNGKTVTARAKIVFEEPDLEKTLPSPDAEKAIAEEKAKRAAKIDAEIARLQAMREAL